MATMKLNVQRGFKAGTRVSTIQVPEELRVKQASGIPWVDDALGGVGGFTRTSTVMLTGGPGTGKSTLVRQLADSMTRLGHIVVYNSGEESLFQAKMSCERLKLTSDFMVAEEVMLPKLLSFMDSVVKANPGKTVVLLQDSLQTLDDGKYCDAHGVSRGTNSKTPDRCTEMLVDWAQRNFAIVIFVGHCTKGGDFAGNNIIKHAVDVHMHMWQDVKEKSETYGCLLFEVQKNRWGANNICFILSLTSTGLEERGTYESVVGKAAA